MEHVQLFISAYIAIPLADRKHVCVFAGQFTQGGIEGPEWSGFPQRVYSYSFICILTNGPVVNNHRTSGPPYELLADVRVGGKQRDDDMHLHLTLYF